MKKLLHFVEATGTDEVVFPADNVTAIHLVSDTAVRIWFKNSDGQTTDSKVDITSITDDMAEEVAEYFALLCAPGSGIGHAGIYKFTEGMALTYPGTTAAGVTGSPVLTTIAYAVGT